MMIETSTAPLDYDTREAMAYHEAGHAAVAIILGIVLRSVRLVDLDDGRRIGCTTYAQYRPVLIQGSPTAHHCRLLQRHLITLSAGDKAQRNYWAGQPEHLRAPPTMDCLDGTSSDGMDALAIADLLVGNVPHDALGTDRVLRLLRLADAAADRMLEHPQLWSAVLAIAGILLEVNCLPGQTVTKVVRERCTVPSATERRRYLEAVFGHPATLQQRGHHTARATELSSAGSGRGPLRVS